MYIIKALIGLYQEYSPRRIDLYMLLLVLIGVYKGFISWYSTLLFSHDFEMYLNSYTITQSDLPGRRYHRGSTSYLDHETSRVPVKPDRGST